MAKTLWQAHAAGRIRAVVGKASDYYGPHAGVSSPLGDAIFVAALAGKRSSLLGNPTLVHSYSFIPDIGEGLVALGADDSAEGATWHLPTDPRPQSTLDMVTAVYRMAGTRARTMRIPGLAVRVIAPFNRIVNELVEMAYEFDEPFVVDSSRIAALGVHATPIEEALERTLASQR
jgi:nucleoside-diphosphate-sugar epimerase